MRKATLRINKGPLGEGAWTYPDARFSEAQLESSGNLTGDGTIEIGHVDVTLLSESVMGVASVLDLPGEADGDPYRPRCSLALGDETIFEGTVSKSAVSSSPAVGKEKERVWELRLEATALSDVMNYLEAQHIAAPSLLSVYDQIGLWIEANTAWPGHPDSTDSSNGSAQIRWYKLPDLWRTVIGEAPEISYVPATPGNPARITLFEHPRAQGEATTPAVMSLQAAETDDSGNVTLPHSLPDWTGKDLLETIQSITGLRLEAEYDPFPSAWIRVTEIEGTWTPAATTLPSLHGREGSSPYDLTTEEPSEADFALWYEGGGAGPETYVATDIKPFDGNDEPRNDGTREIPLRPPEFPDPTEEQSEKYYTDSSELIYVGSGTTVNDSDAFIAAQQEGDLIAYRAQDGSPPDVYNEVWLNEHFQRHPLASAPLHKASGTFDRKGLLLRIGVLGDGFELEGEQWMVRSIQRKEEGSKSADIEGVRPTAEYDPDPPTPELFGEPRNPTLTAIEGRYGAELKLVWDAPDETRLQPENYDFEIYDDEGNLAYSGTKSQRVVKRAAQQAGREVFVGYYARVRANYSIASGWTSSWVDSNTVQ
jgi:hypothetical protein